MALTVLRVPTLLDRQVARAGTSGLGWSRASREAPATRRKQIQIFCQKNGASQGHDMALTVLRVPTSLDRLFARARNEALVGRVRPEKIGRVRPDL